MAIETMLKTIVINKHDLEIHWNKAQNFVPLKGQIIIYDSEVDAQGNTLTDAEGKLLLPEGRTTPYTYARQKIGDGIHTVIELPFNTDHIAEDIIEEVRSTLPPIDQDTGDQSIIANDISANIAQGPFTFASGMNTIAGMKGFYWNYFNNNEIYISTEQPSVLPTEPLYDGAFENPYAVGDVISIVNGSKYTNCATITAIDGNKMILDKSFEFAMKHDDGIDAYTFFVAAKPAAGVVVLGYYANASGENTQALERASHSEGRDTKAIGQYSHAEGRQTTAYYASHAEGRTTNALGEASHAEGQNSTASGNYSHVEGTLSKALGIATHAEGHTTIAQGDYSHSEGNKTRAEGQSSHAEGAITKASGLYAHAEGNSPYDSIRNLGGAGGEASHTEGRNTTAIGDYSHAQGAGTYAFGKGAHAEGIGDDEDPAKHKSYGAHGEASHSEGYRTLAKGSYSHAGGKGSQAGCSGFRIIGCRADDDSVTSLTTDQILDNGYYIIESSKTVEELKSQILNKSPSIYLKSNVDNCGTVTAIEQLADNQIKLIVDKYLHPNSWNTADKAYYYSISYLFFTDAPNMGDIVIGEEAFAAGLNSIAYNEVAHAEGRDTRAIGKYSHAEGRQTQASYAAHAEGYGAKAIASRSHAEGYNTVASGEAAHAEGQQTNAAAPRSHAEGYITKAIGISAHAEGDRTEAQAEASHAEGKQTIATGNYAHAEGNSPYDSIRNLGGASGEASHTEGCNTTAIGDYSHTQGLGTYASGKGAHAEGIGDDEDSGKHMSYGAHGEASHSEGYRTKAIGDYSHAGGECTIAKGTAQTAIGKYNLEDETALLIVGNGNSNKRGNAFTVNENGTATIAADPINDMDVANKKYVNDTINNLPMQVKAGTSLALNYVKNNITGDYSIAEGYNTHAINSSCHAEGRFSTARGTASHAEGYNTTAYLTGSHSEGYGTHAKGQASHAGGTGTIASANSQMAIGKYNREDANALFIVGNGTGDTNRKNIFTVNNNGTATVAANPVKDMDVANKAYVDISLTKFDAIPGELNKLDNRVSRLESQLFDFTTTTSTKQIVPSKSADFAIVEKIGGVTQLSKDTTKTINLYQGNNITLNGEYSYNSIFNSPGGEDIVLNYTLNITGYGDGLPNGPLLVAQCFDEYGYSMDKWITVDTALPISIQGVYSLIYANDPAAYGSITNIEILGHPDQLQHKPIDKLKCNYPNGFEILFEGMEASRLSRNGITAEIIDNTSIHFYGTVDSNYGYSLGIGHGYITPGEYAYFTLGTDLPEGVSVEVNVTKTWNDGISSWGQLDWFNYLPYETIYQYPMEDAGYPVDSYALDLTLLEIKAGTTVDFTVTPKLITSFDTIDLSTEKTILSIAPEILALPDYGKHIDNKYCNHLKPEEGLYRQILKSVDMSTLDWKVCIDFANNAPVYCYSASISDILRYEYEYSGRGLRAAAFTALDDFSSINNIWGDGEGNIYLTSSKSTVDALKASIVGEELLYALDKYIDYDISEYLANGEISVTPGRQIVAYSGDTPAAATMIINYVSEVK